MFPTICNPNLNFSECVTWSEIRVIGPSGWNPIYEPRFCHHFNKMFLKWDLAGCDLPKFERAGISTSFDLVHVRDVIQHIPLRQGCRALQNVATGAQIQFWGQNRNTMRQPSSRTVYVQKQVVESENTHTHPSTLTILPAFTICTFRHLVVRLQL